MEGESGFFMVKSWGKLILLLTLAYPRILWNTKTSLWKWFGWDRFCATGRARNAGSPVLSLSPGLSHAWRGRLRFSTDLYLGVTFWHRSSLHKSKAELLHIVRFYLLRVTSWQQSVFLLYQQEKEWWLGPAGGALVAFYYLFYYFFLFITTYWLRWILGLMKELDFVFWLTFSGFPRAAFYFLCIVVWFYWLIPFYLPFFFLYACIFFPL